MKALVLAKNFFTKGHSRTLRAKKNISVAFATRGISMLISFLIVPLTLTYVDSARYGIWMAISAIINWFSFLDIGLGNGLRNKLAEVLAINDYNKARIYVSSAYALIATIAVGMFSLFAVASFFINWNVALNTELIPNEELMFTVIMVFFFFCIGFVFKILSSILAAMQKYALDNFLQLSSNILGLSAIYILVHTTEGSLFKLCLVYGSKFAIVMLISSLILYSNSLRIIRPSKKYINLKEAVPLTKLGFKFFIAQILFLFSTQTASILVIQFFGPEEVTVYNLARKYIMVASMIYMMTLRPFLSAFTEAFTLNELDWIRNIMNKLYKIWGASSAITILLALFSGIFFKFWVGDKVSIPLILVLILAISSVNNTFVSTKTLFLNGIGKINLQLYVLGTKAVLYIPISILFYKLGFGLISVVVPQILLGFISSFIFFEQYKRIVNQTAKGIWFR